MSATTLIHKAAGSPDYPCTTEGDCALCGAHGAGILFTEWVKPTFTNWDLLRPGTIICIGCLFCADDNSLLLQARMGKDKPQRMRNYSHFVVGGQWLPMHKGMKSAMLDALRAGPSVAVIAVSGQKHIAFRARVGWWQIEEMCAAPDMERLETCLDHVQALYRIFSKGEIADDMMAPHRMMQYAYKYSMADLLDRQAALRPQRGSMAFDLAIFLAQKEDEDDGLVGVPAAISHGAAPADTGVAGAGQQLQEQVRPQHMAAVRGQYQVGGLRVDGEQVLQQSLWEAGDSD